MKTFLITLLLSTILQADLASERMTSSQDETSATIYFYRPKKLASSKPKIIVGTQVPDEVILKIRNGRWKKVTYTKPGSRTFVSGVYAMNPETWQQEIEAGKTYYVKCTVETKMFKVMGALEFVDQETAESEMQGLKEQTKSYLD